MNLFPWLLWLHIFGAILAFGPTYVFSLIGGMGAKEPMHGNFALRITEKIERGMTLPLAALQGITGLGLLLVSGRNLTDSHNYWLGVAIVLYVIALSFSYFVQAPRLVKAVEMTSTPPPPPVPGAAPAGPPPALVAVLGQIRQGGMLLGIMVTVIIFLMIVKPLS